MKEQITTLNVDMNGFPLPFMVNGDKDYFPRLKAFLQDYEKFIGKHREQEIGQLCNDVHYINAKLLSAIEFYYDGEIADALDCIKSILGSCVSAGHCVSTVEGCYAFKGAAVNPPSIYRESYGEVYKDIREFSPLIFYRARIGKEKFDIEDLLHIPFDNRGIIGNQRFSINGMPCLYLASTTYGTWIELGRPAENEFQVSAFKLPSDIKVLDLAIQQHRINGMGSFSSQEEIKQALNYQRIFPLVIAVSGIVKEKNRTFKSEYIIPQLLMLACKSEHIDGIAYLSKQCGDFVGYPQAVNLAIMMSKGSDEKYWDRLGDLEITKPVFYSEFLMRPYDPLEKGDHKAFVNAIFCGNQADEINLANQGIKYTDTDFSRFDEYLAGSGFYNALEWVDKGD